MRRNLTLGAALAILAAGVLFMPSPSGTTRIFTAVTIQRSPEEVFDFVTTPSNWPRWHPASRAVTGAIGHSATVGERVSEDFEVAGHRGRVVWTVLVRQAPYRWVIEGKVEGGGTGRITYRLLQARRMTRFEREFVYAAPNLFFAALDRLYLRKRIEEQSDAALRRLRNLLESRS